MWFCLELTSPRKIRGSGLTSSVCPDTHQFSKLFSREHIFQIFIIFTAPRTTRTHLDGALALLAVPLQHSSVDVSEGAGGDGRHRGVPHCRQSDVT